jgi:FkbM family methyltransferase
MSLYDFGKGLHHLVDLEKLPDNPFVIDAGACVGDFCLAMTELRPNCQILAIEPSRRNRKQLEETLANMDNVTFVDSALVDEEGEIKMYDAYGRDGKFYQWGSVKEYMVSKAKGRKEFEKIDEYTVKATTLDKLIDGRKVNYLKMDIEGSEREVLQGLSQETADLIEQISFENHYKNFSLGEHLVKLGFTVTYKGHEIYGCR